MARSHPSLDLILDEVRFEREGALKHFDALDAKAGIVLGFAGALVALAPVERSWLVDLGRTLAVISGLTALATYWPRGFFTTNLRELRRHYLAAEVGFTKSRLLDTQINMVVALAEVLKGKARRLKVAMASLAGATVMVAMGLVVD